MRVFYLFVFVLSFCFFLFLCLCLFYVVICIYVFLVDLLVSLLVLFSSWFVLCALCKLVFSFLSFDAPAVFLLVGLTVICYMIVCLFVVFICCDCLCCSMFNCFFSVFFLFSCSGSVGGNKLVFWPVGKSLFVGMLYVFSVIFVCLCYCLCCCLCCVVCRLVYRSFCCLFDFVVLYTLACLLDCSLCNSLE